MLTPYLRLFAFVAIAIGVGSPAAAQKFEGLAQTPPMGWNSWNKFDCDIDEQLVRETADALVSTGLRDAGYVYVNLDDCWHGERDEDGFIQPDRERFPSGMKALGDYIHARGLKFGIYSDAGEYTCQKRPGSQGYEYQDALQYARWGVDYLKYDWCYTGEGDAQRNPIEAYTTMRDAMHAAGRPMVFSICEWGESEPWTWAKDVGHLWRTTGDIINCWDCTVDHGTWKSYGIMQILDMQDGKRQAAGAGHWNDPDMLEFGNLASLGENRAHFAMWAMLAAPLILGTDIRKLDEAELAVLKNRELLAVALDPKGIQGYPIRKGDGLEVWVRPLAGGDFALAFLNRGNQPLSENYAWPEDGLKDNFSGFEVDFGSDAFNIRNVWSGADAGDTSSPLSVTVGARDVAVYRLSR